MQTRTEIYCELRAMKVGFCGIKFGGYLIWRSGPNSFVVGSDGIISIHGTGRTLDEAADKVYFEKVAEYQTKQKVWIESGNPA